MFCPNCGSSVDGKFCTNCGAKMEFQDQVESFVQNEIPQPVFSNQPEASAPETADEPQFTVAAVEPDVERYTHRLFKQILFISHPCRKLLHIRFPPRECLNRMLPPRFIRRRRLHLRLPRQRQRKNPRQEKLF